MSRSNDAGNFKAIAEVPSGLLFEFNIIHAHTCKVIILDPRQRTDLSISSHHIDGIIEC